MQSGMKLYVFSKTKRRLRKLSKVWIMSVDGGSFSVFKKKVAAVRRRFPRFKFIPEKHI